MRQIEQVLISEEQMWDYFWIRKHLSIWYTDSNHLKSLCITLNKEKMSNIHHTMIMVTAIYVFQKEGMIHSAQVIMIIQTTYMHKLWFIKTTFLLLLIKILKYSVLGFTKYGRIIGRAI